MKKEFGALLAQSSPEASSLAQGARDLIQRVDPQVVEVVWLRQRIAGYGVGPKKMSEHYCYIALFKERINLGFNYGAALPDPEGLLEGSGENMRHVKIQEESQLRSPALRELLEQARLERLEALARSST